MGLLIGSWTQFGCTKESVTETISGGPSGPSKGLRFLLLEGTPRERGRIHGETLRSEIEHMISYFNDMVVEGGEEPDAFRRRIVHQAGFLDACQRWTPHVVEEIRGIADGSGEDFETIFAWNLLDEAEWYLNGHTWTTSEVAEASRCSVFGVPRDGEHPAIVAQNADMGPTFDGYQTICHVRHAGSDLEELLLTLPGVTGVYGMSNRSLAVCLNALTMSLNRSTDGLATVFISRGILAQDTLEDAIGFVTTAPHASGECYTFGDSERVVCYEGSANSVVEFSRSPHTGRVFHTNHPLVNHDSWVDFETLSNVAPQLREGLEIGIANSTTRFASLEHRLLDPPKTVDVPAAIEILASHDSDEFPICRHDERGNITTFSMVMAMTEPPVMHVAAGPPCKTEFETYRFDQSIG